MATAMTSIRLLLVLSALLLALAQTPARAADVIYPPGSRIGLAPPPGRGAGTSSATRIPTTTSPSFWWRAAGRGLCELDKTVGAESFKRQGVTLETREAMPLSTGAFLVIGHQEMDKTNLRKWFLVASSPALTAFVTVQVPDAAKARYPDEVIRAALSALAVRSSRSMSSSASCRSRSASSRDFASPASSRGAPSN